MSLYRSLRIALLCTVLLAIAGGAVLAAVDCFSCHDRAGFQKKVRHDPAVEGNCSTCHNPHLARYEGLLKRDVPRLCYSCHSEQQELSQPVIHRPVREGKCTACHAPHSSDEDNLLKARSAEVCFSCHSIPKQYQSTHAPFAQGRCFDCHAAHQSANQALLHKEGDKLCFGCHEANAVQKKHPNFPAAVKNCGTCHSPHGSDNRHLIRNVLHDPYSAGCGDCHVEKGAPVRMDVCLGCHEDVVTQMASSHNHLVRLGENGCVACHSPHAADDKRLLRGKERYVCSTCHQDTFERYDSAHYKHMTTDTCTDCHVPHGSNYPNMTKAPINEVCAPCHERHVQFTHPIGEKVFDPRTLQMMTCVTCHSVKGSEHYKHLRLDGHKDLCVQCHRKS